LAYPPEVAPPEVAHDRRGVFMQLDHLIVSVNDIDASLAFYRDVLGMTIDEPVGPFSVVRVTPDLTLQLAPWGTDGGMHLAFAMPAAVFDDVFGRIKDAGIEYGDSFHDVGNMQGPGEEPGAHGMGKSIYCFDPSKHLIEIRHYD
jgi:catechol 2,3-dioxygenase-like lactoylglutathione lyase family enzyme